MYFGPPLLIPIKAPIEERKTWFPRACKKKGTLVQTHISI